MPVYRVPRLELEAKVAELEARGEKVKQITSPDDGHGFVVLTEVQLDRLVER